MEFKLKKKGKFEKTSKFIERMQRIQEETKYSNP